MCAAVPRLSHPASVIMNNEGNHQYTMMQWLQWRGSKFAQSPVFQFVASLATILAWGKSGAAKWFANHKEAVAAMGITTVIQVVQYLRAQDAQFKQIAISVSAVETTSQVCATRMNIMEWRR